MKYIDLHTHSTASDGTDSPGELITKASRLGLAAIALTDHDTVDGLDEAAGTAADERIELIRGCELSTATEMGNLHIVGLWLPANCDPLKKFLKNLSQNRRLRNEQMIAKMRNAGVSITLEELRERARGSIGRPHMAEVLVEKGYAIDRDDAFATWLGVNGRAYVPKPAPSPREAIRQINNLGGSAVLAHPLLRPLPPQWLETLVKNMARDGLFGLEAWHSALSPEATKTVIELANKFNLALSGGSDYHGANKPDIDLATGKGNLAIDYGVLEKMKARRQAAGLPI